MNADPAAKKDVSKPVSRILYALFFVLAIYFTAKGDYGTAASNLGIALIFDPFPNKTFTQRPKWQQAWLVVHVAAVLGLFIWSVAGR